MPVKVQNDLPAKGILENENIFVMDEDRAMHQNIRPLSICILNLMPVKQDTELQLLRALSNTPLQIAVSFMKMNSHVSLNTPIQHLNQFYKTFDELKNNKYDGLIITGAPVEQIPFEEVDYWKELCEIMEWSKIHVHCTMHVCWGAYAALYYHYGIKSYTLDKKLSGVYSHTLCKHGSPLFRGFDDIFYAPHSRGIDIHKEDVLKVPELEIMAMSEEAGVTIVKTTDSKHFFVNCHLEYDYNTLQLEYERDLNKGMNPAIPEHYFPDDDPSKRPLVTWRSAGQLLFSNWLNFYVYQTTRYEIGTPPTKEK